MAGHDEGSNRPEIQRRQLRSRVGADGLYNGKTMPTLSDRVGKRGWTKKACLECHRRKIKCDMTTKTRCTSCEKLDIPCSVNEYRRRRNKEKRSKIEQLESNIERMENVFEQLGLMRSGDCSSDNHLAYSQSHVTWQTSSLQTQDRIDTTWDTMSDSGSDHSKIISEHQFEILHYRKGSPTTQSGDHAFSQNLTRPENHPDFTETRASDKEPDHGKISSQIDDDQNESSLLASNLTCSLDFSDNVETFGGASTPRTLYPLPGIAETMVLFLEYLENFNSICPIFQPLSLLSICDDENSITPNQADRWACMNVVLALAHTMRSKSSDVTQANHQISWMFMRNALQTANTLCNGPPTLWAAQALLGMTIFFLGTLNSKPCDRLADSALRISHRILSDELKEEPGEQDENSQHCRVVYWIAFCLDREISLRFGRSPCQSDEHADIMIEFSPGLKSHVCAISSDREEASFDVFRSYCELSVIKGQVYELLRSATDPKQSGSILAKSVAILDQRLQAWKSSVPKMFRPDVQETASFPESKVAVTLLSLHFSYFNCLLSMHQVIRSHGPTIYAELAKSYSSGLLSEDIALLSGILCQNAARSSIKLMKHMPKGNPSMVGILLHYLIVATTELSKNIISNPRLESGTCDMSLLNKVERFLASVVLTAPNKGMHRVVQHCAEHRFLAQTAVSRVGAPSVG